MRQKNETLRVQVTGYESSGMGVAKLEGEVFFIRGAVVGDDCTVQVLKPGKINYCKINEIHTSGAGRVLQDDCPYSRFCGGCDVRHMSVTEEGKFKRQKVTDALERIGDVHIPIEEYIESPSDKRYRNKAIFPVGKKDGKTVFGFYRRNSHDLIPIEDCKIQKEEAVAVAKVVCFWMDRYQVSCYSEQTRRGLIRQIYVRTAADGKSNCTLVCTQDHVPHEKELIQSLTDSFEKLQGICININKTYGNTVLGKDYRTIWGKADLEDILCGNQYEISPSAFYQVNHDQTENLYSKAIEYAQLKETDSILDLYCGIGTITLTAACKVKEAIGVEINTESIEDAKRNAGKNSLQNVAFYAEDAGKAAERFMVEGRHPNVIIVDPPRKGLDDTGIESIVKMNPNRIVYVSCDPGTLARDLKKFESMNYKTERVSVVNMFPRTKHVETVVLLSGEKVDGHIDIDLDVESLKNKEKQKP